MSDYQALFLAASIYLSRALPPRAALWIGIITGISAFAVHNGWWH